MENKLKLGGMALHNGVLLISPNYWAVSLYDKDDKLKTFSGSHAKMSTAVGKVPVAGGLAGLGKMFGLMFQVQRQVPEAKFAHKDLRSLAPMLLSMAVTVPMTKKFGKDDWRTQVAGALTPLLAQGAMLRTAPIGRFHGAEHKAVTSYERDIPAKDAPREHPRCGTGLALTSIVSTTLTSQALGKVMPKQAAGLVGQLVGMGLAVETMKASNTPVGKVALNVSMFAQRHLTTAEPTDYELDAGVSALNTLLELEGSHKS